MKKLFEQVIKTILFIALGVTLGYLGAVSLLGV
jgi:hypothetical protein